MWIGGFVLALLLAAPSQQHGIWPEYLGEWTRTSVQPAEFPQPAAFGEYGLEAAERAEFTVGPRIRMVATGYRFRDAIGGYAGYLALRPADAKPSKFDEIASESGDSVFVLFGNYVFRFDGGLPDYPVYEQLLAYVPRLDQAALPEVRLIVPNGAIPNSERWIAGPETLASFAPGLPPSIAAFRMGAQGISTEYAGDGGPFRLAIMSYETPATAANRCAAFQQLPGAKVRCFDSYVAVTFSKDAKAASVLDRVRPYVPPPPPPPPKQPEGVGLFSALVVLGVIAVGIGMGILLRKKPQAGVPEEQIRLELNR
ncbi:MAG TPA: hypothetical protein VN428_06390 [Bryobacteraceae bacterium]|nr:hypothetical protein [Bryobacteraceae bacterium]